MGRGKNGMEEVLGREKAEGAADSATGSYAPSLAGQAGTVLLSSAFSKG